MGKYYTVEDIATPNSDKNKSYVVESLKFPWFGIAHYVHRNIAIDRWCTDNCKGDWVSNCIDRVRFENHKDAVAFAKHWGISVDGEKE